MKWQINNMGEQLVINKADTPIRLNKPSDVTDFMLFDNRTIPDIIKYSEVLIGNIDLEIKEFDYPVFIMNNINQYIHFLVDNIGLFLFLKEYIPELQLKILIKDKEKHNFKSSQHEEILKLLEIETKDCLLYAEEGQYLFKDVYDINIRNNRSPASNTYDFPFTYIKKYLGKYCVQQNKYDKIFISRSKTKSTQRSLEDEINLDYYFSKLGFTVLHLENLSFTEQINCFYNAKVVAGISGTGLTNTIFCKKNTKVIDINTSPGNYYWSGWSRISKVCELDYIGILFNLYSMTSIELISKLEKHSISTSDWI